MNDGRGRGRGKSKGGGGGGKGSVMTEKANQPAGGEPGVVLVLTGGYCNRWLLQITTGTGRRIEGGAST